jgi:hypothetical protein
MKTLAVLSASLLFVGLANIPASADDAAMIKNAEMAAPPTLSSQAAIYAMGQDGKMRTLREGANGWWCMPDDPSTPGNDPMCGDANSMEWAMAWIGKTEPPKGKIGFMYMLMGGPAASNTDPYAMAPPEGKDWIMDRPHVMIVNFGDSMSGYPTGEENPDTSRNAICSSHAAGAVAANRCGIGFAP